MRTDTDWRSCNIARALTTHTRGILSYNQRLHAPTHTLKVRLYALRYRNKFHQLAFSRLWGGKAAIKRSRPDSQDSRSDLIAAA